MIDILKDAFKTAFSKPLTYIALVAIPIIVACFGLLYFNTFLDPYEKMKSMPIAVVNEDTGCTMNDSERNFGNELVERLQENDEANWTPEEPAILDEGLENTDYYLAVIIPSDFSERVSAGETRNPEQANITFFKNARKNYMLSSISSNIENKLKEQVNQSITEQYAKAYLDGLATAQDGFSDAADGANRLNDGISNAANGSQKITDDLNTLTEGSSALEEGLSTLNSGLSQLNDAGTALTAGSQNVQSALAKLESGSQTFNSTIEGKEKSILASCGGDPSASIAALKQDYASELKKYATNVAIVAQQGEDPSNVSTAALNQAVEKLAGASSSAGAYQALETVSESYEQINNGISTLNSQYATLNKGIQSYTQADDKLQTGAASAQTGAASLTQGAAKLQSGSQTLTDGLNSAGDGSETLADSLSNGAQDINNSLTASNEDLASYTANPTDVEENVYGDLEKFGYGFAPLFLTLCLWLGSLLIFFIFDPFPSRTHARANRFQIIIGRWPLYLVLVAIEVATVVAGALASGLPCTNIPMMILLFAVMGVSFMLIMQFFNLFDIPGKAIAVLFVIFQLVFCSGTFPAQLGSDFAVAAGPFLPFYYAIDAMREVMSGGNMNVVFGDMGVLLAFGVGAVICSLLAYPVALKAKKKRDKATLEALLGKEALPA